MHIYADADLTYLLPSQEFNDEVIKLHARKSNGGRRLGEAL